MPGSILSQLGDTQLEAEAPTALRLKGEPYRIFSGQQTDATSDATLELTDFNAVVIKTLVSGKGVGGIGLPTAAVIVLEWETPAGIFLECTDPQGAQLAVSGSTQATVICGSH